MDGLLRARMARGLMALSIPIGLSGGGALARADGPPGAGPPAVQEITAALRKAKTHGVPVVVVATSAARPDSKAFWQRLADGPWARSRRGLVQIVEFPVESSPGLAESMKIRATPTVLAYAPGPDGPACVGSRVGGLPEDAAAWLGTLPLGDGTGRPDPGVVQAGYDGGYPTPQAPYYPQTPAPQAPPVASYPVMTAQPQPQVPMMVAQPVQPPMMMAQPFTPSQVVQVPGPNVVVQQGEARVFLAQPNPGVSFAPQVASPSPNMFMPNVASAPAPMMVSSPQPAQQPMVAFAPQPAQQPMVAFAPQPVQQPMVAYNPQPVQQPMVAYNPGPAVAAAPSVAVASVTNQTVGLPTAGSRTRVRVRGPGPIRSGLASFGEKLTHLGRSRIETIQETDLNTPSIQGGGGVATLSTSTTSPLPPQQQQTYLTMPQQQYPVQVAAPAPQPQPQTQPEVEYAPAPSPQGAPPRQGHFHKRSS